MDFEKRDKKLIIHSREGQFEKDFKFPIREVLEIQGRLIVRLDTLGRKDINTEEKNRNIFCLNERGDILWQIQDPDTYPPGFPKSDSPFVGMRLTKDGKLRATSWDSHAYDVDIETGTLSNAEFTK